MSKHRFVIQTDGIQFTAAANRENLDLNFPGVRWEDNNPSVAEAQDFLGFLNDADIITLGCFPGGIVRSWCRQDVTLFLEYDWQQPLQVSAWPEHAICASCGKKADGPFYCEEHKG